MYVYKCKVIFVEVSRMIDNMYVCTIHTSYCVTSGVNGGPPGEDTDPVVCNRNRLQKTPVPFEWYLES